MLLSALGHRLRLEFDDSLSEDQVSLLEEQWRDAEAHGTEEDLVLTAGLRLDGAASSDIDGASFTELASNITVRVTLKALELQQGQLLLLHSCGVTLEDGRVAAFVGPSGRGKTTAARALGKHYAYVSDETIGIGPDGSVHPYRKPLSIIVEQGKTKQQTSPSSLGLLPLPDAPLQLAAIVLLERELDGPDVPVIEEVSLTEGMAALMPETSYMMVMEAPLQRLARTIDATGGLLRVRYREATSLVGVVDSLVNRQPRLKTWIAKQVTPSRTPRPGALLARTDVDAIEHDDSLLIFADSNLRVLRGIGPRVWELADGSVTEQQIISTLRSELGEPAEGTAKELVQRAVEELLDARLLTRTA